MVANIAPYSFHELRIDARYNGRHSIMTLVIANTTKKSTSAWIADPLRVQAMVTTASAMQQKDGSDS